MSIGACEFGYLNSFYPTIKYKCNKDVNYSFTTRRVYLVNTPIWVDHITNNIPYSLGYRLRRKESIQDKFELNLTKLREELLLRGYDESVVSLAFSRVRLLDQQSTLEKVARPEDGYQMAHMNIVSFLCVDNHHNLIPFTQEGISQC